jgi:hypothetical protein
LIPALDIKFYYQGGGIMKKIKSHMCGKVFESGTIHAECPQCLNIVNCDLHELEQSLSEEQRFESFCKENDLEYDFEFYSGGKYYRNSETNKAFCIFKYAPKESK